MYNHTTWPILLLALLLKLTPLVVGIGRAACQAPEKEDALHGCPSNTLVVGKGEKFRTIQSAVRSIPNDDTPYTILVQPGTYTEQVNVTRRGPLTLLGTTSAPNDYTKNTVTIKWKASEGTGGKGGDNALTSTFTVAPNLDASLTGRGPTGHAVSRSTPFGNVNFRAYNIKFVNEGSSGPSLAVSVSYANAGFYFCSTRSLQDTVYIGKVGSAFFYGGEVAGQTDFLYGFGTAWIQSAILHLRGCGGGITAWKGTETSFPNKYGVYIHESEIKKEGSVAPKSCALGRPWNDRHRSIFANCELDNSIKDSGYTMWSSEDRHYTKGLTMMAEYKNTGAGAKSSRGVDFAKVLSSAEYEPWSSVEKVFQYPNGTFGNVEWIDRNPKA